MKWTRENVLQILTRDNPHAPQQALSIYADLFLQYRQATDSIAEDGTVCAHPRTGQPMENPYLRVQASALSSMAKLKVRLKTDELWK